MGICRGHVGPEINAGLQPHVSVDGPIIAEISFTPGAFLEELRINLK